ncbi:hypothetical protein D7Y27_15320 [Corallococcus sp. AB004]|uniref:hypothetical protein n=1 Tax=Corallococcus TaxID=83461 RepID=UPI000EA119A8|nr:MULTISPECIES: hypothetical protein [Corallococcus]NNB86744.1 hypothetical protein [Corallococcus exiguus]RKH93649.1 hypothetical protein D7Y04_40320 [Corallococcus sp. AB038B]RKI06640.1 hypothetical protein D7Y15_30175 [Corallococcus sp. AB030]RKI43344.1 hypothetical protein D7Y27_15320 [Corallococcus sp. AB004]
MRDGLFVALHLVAGLANLVSAASLLLGLRSLRRRMRPPNTGRPVLRVLPGGLSTQREEAKRHG